MFPELALVSRRLSADLLCVTVLRWRSRSPFAPELPSPAARRQVARGPAKLPRPLRQHQRGRFPLDPRRPDDQRQSRARPPQRLRHRGGDAGDGQRHRRPLVRRSNRRAELHAMLLEKGRSPGSSPRSIATRRASGSGSRRARGSSATAGRASRATTRHGARGHGDGPPRCELQERFEKITSIVSRCLYQLRIGADGTVDDALHQRRAKHLYGVTPEEVEKDATALAALRPPGRLAVLASFAQSRRDADAAPGRVPRSARRSGVEKWVFGHAVPEREPDGSIIWHGYITRHDGAEALTRQRSTDLAYFDPLTGLPNRAALVDRLRPALADGAPAGWGALLFIDLDQFKILNDTKGHHVGDRLLVRGRPSASATLRSTGRHGRAPRRRRVRRSAPGPGRDAPERPTSMRRCLRRKVLAALLRPFTLDGFPFHTSASIGVALFQRQRGGADESSSAPTSRCTRPRRPARSRCASSSPRCKTPLEERLALSTELRDALGGRQPDAGLSAAGREHRAPASASRRCSAGTIPVRGDMSAGRFHSARRADRAGGLIDAFVLSTACATLRRWQDDPVDARPAVWRSTSARSSSAGRSFVDRRRACAATGVDPQLLTVELTEHVMLDDMTEVGEVDAAGSRRSASRSRSTTSAPAIRRCPTSSGCRSTR